MAIIIWDVEFFPMIQIWDVLSNNEVASIVWAAESEEAAAKAVVEAAAEAWKRYPSSKHDDCTVVCHFLQSQNWTKLNLQYNNNCICGWSS